MADDGQPPPTQEASTDQRKVAIESSEVITASADYNSRNHLIESSDIVKKGSKPIAARETWGKKLDFLLSVAGGFIGLGNIWRFPYLCYRNGGGAFLIPYFIFLVLAGVPLFFLEIGLGQFTSEGGITAWERIAPITAGIGYGSIALTTILNMYYIVVLAWSCYYMWYSFYSELPWMQCGEWASNCCVPDGEKRNGSCIRDDQNNTDGTPAIAEWTSPSQEFWENKVLRVTDGVDDMGSLNWGMVGCLIFSWIISYFCVWKSVKQTGKVVYFTATFPLVMLMVLLIRGITLPGAWDGVYYYMVPDLDKMKEPKVWVEAGTQIFFSYALCKGQLISLGSYNKYKTDIYKDVWVLSAFNSGTSFVSGFAIFSILGYMANERKMDIADVAESGPGLAFIAYPRAVALMPCPQLWAVLFFIMILLLGLDSQFVGLEAIITAVTDISRERDGLQYRKGMKRQYLLFVIVGVSFCVGLTMCLDGGIYIFTLFDYYGASGICLLWLCLCECLAVGWVYALLFTTIKKVLYFFLYRDFKPFTYKNTRRVYEYPMWFEKIGWCLAACSILPVIIYAIVRSVAIFFTDTDRPIAEAHRRELIKQPLEQLTPSVYWLGDMLSSRLRRRGGSGSDGGYLPTSTDDDIIRYNGDNTNC